MSDEFSSDVLIVGGGIAGASLGARLAASGLDVTILEAEERCGMHATGRSAAFWMASLGGDTPERALTLASKPMFDMRWPGSDVPLLRPRGAIHLTGPSGEAFGGTEGLAGEDAPKLLGREDIDAMLPGLKPQWTGGYWEESCADIDVAALHATCISAFRKAGGRLVCDAALIEAYRDDDLWRVRARAGEFAAPILANAAGAWGDVAAERAGVAPLGLEPRRRTVVQLRVGRSGLKDLPFVTDLHESFYFKGEGERSVWVCPLDQTPSAPCDAAAEEIDVATAIDRFEQAVDWPVEAVEAKWAGLRTFAPDGRMKFGFDPDAEGFFWCVGQGGMGIQTAPAYSLLCASLIRGDAMPGALEGIDPAAFAPTR